MFNIKEVTTDTDLLVVEELASIIWNEHYIPIIGKGQVDYMLDKFQSVDVMKQQLDEGMKYHLLFWNDDAVGYMAYKEEDKYLFLSKIYVQSSHRGKKIGKLGMDLVNFEAKRKKKEGIRLTVNKYNTGSIKAYEKMGFKVIDEVVADIGNNYVMDDYVLVKEV